MKFKYILSAIVLLMSVLCLVALAQPSESEQGKNMAQMKRFYEEVVNQGNFDLFDKMVAADFKEHEDLAGFPPTKDGIKQFFTAFRNAFPDLKFTVEDMVASGDKVWSYILIQGTHKEEFMGIAPSGNKIKVKGFDIVRFKNGKATDHWGVTDVMAMMQQMGAFQEPPAAGTKK